MRPDRFERALMFAILLLIIALTVYSMVASMANTAYDAGMVERATLAARQEHVEQTLTAIR